MCGKLGAMKITPNDCLHQEYLTINLGSTSNRRQLKLPLVRFFWRWRGRCWPAGAAWGRECRRRCSGLPLNLSDTAATSQDGSSLTFIAAIAGTGSAIFRMQVAEGCACPCRVAKFKVFKFQKERKNTEYGKKFDLEENFSDIVP